LHLSGVAESSTCFG